MHPSLTHDMFTLYPYPYTHTHENWKENSKHTHTHNTNCRWQNKTEWNGMGQSLCTTRVTTSNNIHPHTTPHCCARTEDVCPANYKQTIYKEKKTKRNNNILCLLVNIIINMGTLPVLFLFTLYSIVRTKYYHSWT